MEKSNLNEADKVLKKITELNGTAKHIFTRHLHATVPLNNPNDVHAGLLADIASQLTRLPKLTKTILDTIKGKLNGGLIDDRQYVLEEYVGLAASLPSDSPILPKVTQAFIKLLWGSLTHPPHSFLGTTPPPRAPACEWRFRTADGSNNSRSYPHLGQAGSPYARTLAPRTELPPALPDPGLIFDEIFARGEETREHPNKLSSMLFYLASIIIHDCFRTNRENCDIVDSSSYLDLAPLYGHNQEEQDKVRSGKDGMLKPDCFSEYRLFGFPPGVAVLLICFNRFHNWIAEELKTINEAGRFTLKRGPNAEKQQDEDLFQTARLITCGLYINIVLTDYVRTILNLNRSNSDWSLDPRVGLEKGNHGTPDGVGNQVSVEFNLVYRWHSAISRRDEQWSMDFFKQAAGGQDPSTINPERLGMIFGQYLGKLASEPPAEVEIPSLSRIKQGDKKGYYKDEDLVKILTESTEDVAGAFGARNVPVCMKAIEILGMEQARSWNVATLNEFRKYFNLVPHKTFEDITSNPGVAQSLKALYGDPDMVELYPGLVAEDAKEPIVPGSGLCGGFTLTTGILADATALVRGDRFYTLDFNAASLTNWGFGQIQSNPRIAGGGVFYKLFMRAFPNWYTGNSVYAMFPMVVPEEQRKILKTLGQEDLYDFTPPRHNPEPIPITSYDAVVKVLDDQEHFKVPWGPNIKYITKHEYMLGGDSPVDACQKKFISNAISCPSNADAEMKKLYYETTVNLLKTKSSKLRHGYMVDAIADIGNPSHAIAAAKIWHYPLKTPTHPTGAMTPEEFYTAYSLCFAWTFLDLDPAKEFELRHYAQQASEPITELTRVIVRHVQNSQWTQLRRLLGLSTTSANGDNTSNSTNDNSHGDGIEHSFGANLILRMSANNQTAEQVAAAIIPTVTGMVATQAQGFAQMLDLLLSEPYYSDHWHTIETLARSDDARDFETLKKYGMEAFRLAPPAFGLFRNVETEGGEVVVEDVDVDGKGEVKKKIHHFKAGDKVYTNFVTAGLNPSIFPHPKEINLTRPPSLYISQGHGPHTCIGRSITSTAMASQLKAFGQLKNLRRAPGPQGQMKYKTMDKGSGMKGVRLYMKADGSDYWPFPTGMRVCFEGFTAGMGGVGVEEGESGVWARL